MERLKRIQNLNSGSRKINKVVRTIIVLFFVCMCVTGSLYFVCGEEPKKLVVFHGESSDEIKKIDGAEITCEIDAGKIGNCFALRDDKSWIDLLNSEFINPKEGTIAMWVKNEGFEKVPKDRDKRYIFSSYYGNRQVFQLGIVYYHNTPQIQPCIGRMDDKGDVKYYAIDFFPNEHGWKADEWHHLAVSWGKNKMKMYVDGVLYKEVESPGPVEPTYPVRFYIGACASAGPTPQHYFYGLIDEIVISKTELKEGEILSLFKYGSLEVTKEGVEPTEKVELDYKGSLVLNAIYTSKPPKIDGNLLDECWKEAAVAKPFYLVGKETPAPKETTAYVLFDKDYLYVAFKCMEPDISKLVVKDRDRFNFYDDHIEIFISPFEDKEKYFQICVNVLGNVWDAYNTGSASKGNLRVDDTWDSDIKVAVFTEANAYIVEVAIPIRCLAKYKFASDWGINFCRDSINPYFNSWCSKGLEGYQRPENFCVLKGIGKGLPEKVIEISEFDIGDINLLTSTLKFKITNLSDSDRNLTAFFTVKDKDRKFLADIKRKFVLKKGETKTIKIPYKINRRGETTYRLDIDEPAKKISLWSTGDVFIKIPDEAEIFFTDPHYKDTVFEKYPPSAVKGFVNINVPLSGIRKGVVDICLKDPDGLEVYSEKIKVSKVVKFEFGVEKLKKFGKYMFSVAGTKKDGTRIKAEKSIKYLQSIKGETFIDKQGFLVVDGKRFFPIGSYCYTTAIDRGWVTPDETYGFNTAVACGAPGTELEKLIDKYKAYNLFWIPAIDAGYKSVAEGNWAKLKNDLEKTNLKNPYLIAWTIADEPLGVGTPVENLKKGHEIISEMDPYHPVTLVDNWASNTRITFDAVDFMLMNIYPVFGRQPYVTMYNELTAASKHKNAKPIIAVPEALNLWLERTGAPHPAVEKYEQMEAIAFLAIVAKARGIIWFASHHATKTQFEWMCAVAKNKIVPIVPILLTDDLPEEAQSKNSDIYCLSKKYKDNYYVISVNSVDKEIKDVEIVLPKGWKALRCEEFYKNTPVNPKENIIKENYSPLEVKVYKIICQ